MDLSAKIAGTELKNPFMNGSGIFNTPKHLKDIEKFGFAAAVSKSLTKEPRAGNTSPTIIDFFPGCTLNRVNLANQGVDTFVQELCDYEYKIPLVGSAAGFSVEEYIYVASILQSSPAVKLIEVNLACPNTDGNILCFEKEFLEELLSRLDKELSKPYAVKLAPFTNFKDLRKTIEIIEGSKAKAIVLTNTLPVRMDYKGKMYNWGQSGKSIFGLSLRNVYEAHKHTKLDIIGCGGITGPASVIDYIRNGAKAVQMATVLNTVSGTDFVKTLEAGISKYMQDKNYFTIEDFRGKD